MKELTHDQIITAGPPEFQKFQPDDEKEIHEYGNIFILITKQIFSYQFVTDTYIMGLSPRV